MQIRQILEGVDVIGLEVRDASRFSDFEQQLKQSQIKSFTITNGNAGLSAAECITLLQCLDTLENLTSLSLNVNQLMSEDHNAGPALALLFRRNKLQSLELYGNVTDSNIFFASVHEALKSNTSLKHFGIYCQNFGDDVYSDIARIINMKGLQKFKITLGGFSAAPLDALIGFDELMDSVSNISNFSEIDVVAMQYIDHAIAAYNALIPEQAIKKKLQERVEENYIADLHMLIPNIDNSLLNIPEELFGRVIQYIPGLTTVLKIIYPECKTMPALMTQLVKDMHRAKCEILWANTVREQVLGYQTIRTGLYFDAMRGMRTTVGDSTVDANSTKRRDATSTKLVTYKI